MSYPSPNRVLCFVTTTSGNAKQRREGPRARIALRAWLSSPTRPSIRASWSFCRSHTVVHLAEASASKYLQWCGAILISTTRSAGSSSQKPMLINGLMPGLLEFRIPMRRSPMASCRRVYSPRSRMPCSGTWTCAEAFVANRRTCLTTKTA